MAWEIDRPVFPAGYKTLGDLRCPQCLAMREFIVPEDCNSASLEDQAASAECCECHYAFGYHNDEMVEGDDGRFRTERRPVLSLEVVRKAQETALKKFRRDMLASGVRLERLNGRAKVHTPNS